MKKRSLLIFGNYGGQNWGDEAILSGILSDIPKDVFSITVLSSNPTHTKKMHQVNSVFLFPFGIRSFFCFRFFETIKTLRSADLILFGGGGLFQDREKKAVWLWGWHHFVASLFKKPILFVGNSVGPLQSRISQRITKKSFQTSPFISVRDSSSKDILQKIGIPKDRIVVSTDAVFLLKKLPKPKQRRGSLLLLRGDGFLEKEKIKKIFSSLPKPIRAIAMDRGDAFFLNSLDIPLLVPESILDLRKMIAGAKLVVSSRLHGGILALQAETPFLLFSAAPKIQHFFSERGLANFIFPEDFSLKRGKEKLSALLKKSADIQKKLSKIRIKEEEKAKNILPVFLRKKALI